MRGVFIGLASLWGQSNPIALALVVLVTSTPSASLGRPSCLGDCSESGYVTVADLVTGVNIALGASPVSHCPAFDGGSGAVTIDVLVTAVRNALQGCPQPTPTVTPEPDLVLSRIDDAFGGLCGPVEYYYARAAESGYEGFCSSINPPGVYTNLTLQRFDDSAAAAGAFADASRVGPPIDFAGLPAAYWERGHGPPHGVDMRSMVWQLGCWVIAIHSDNQNGRQALAPDVVSQAIFDAAAPLLLERCPPEDPVPTPTATKAIGADLVVSSISVYADNSPCQPHAVLSVCIANAGRVAAGEFTVAVSPVDYQFSIPELPAGGADCVGRRLDTFGVMTIEVDADGEVDEIDEANNTLSQLTMRPPRVEATCRPTRVPTVTPSPTD